MGADVSRARFDPMRDFAGLVLQQGRLLLDADDREGKAPGAHVAVVRVPDVSKRTPATTRNT